MGGALDNRAAAVNQCQKYENEWKRELKDLNKQNNIVLSIANQSGSCYDINKIKNIRAKTFKKHDYSSSDIYSSDSNSLLSSGIE